ncbi:hypothetical protein BJ508DRAFT_413316 [Ascobolus immersus RN42]|uniref:Sec20 C-terminal domain-containing protein n=1 Tax=Ascobolus immersus RN42 TaxID=1160509 RepID=A0A3N4IHL6_ASCIM|nr:hypothetical protein BJ508DRAFT_413316 [Ascobolus immersus RN42]
MATTLTRKLTALQESNRECAALITQLGNTNLKTLGTKRNGQPDLAAQVHTLLKTLEQDAEFLELEIADESDPELRQSLQSKFKAVQDAIRRSRLHYRKAQLASKRAADQSHRLERELVYSSRTAHHTPTEDQTANDVVLSAASDVTLSLRRTHALLSNSLQQSNFTRETLASSTQALKELSHRYSRVDEIMLSSRKLVVDLIRKNKSDSWYYEKAIWILAATLAWLVFRRFLWGPLWLFVWMPMKSTYWILGNVKGLLGGAAEVQGIDVLLSSGVAAVPTMAVQPPVIDDGPDARVAEKVRQAAEEDNMVDEVGRIIDEAEHPNPLKRAWEEPALDEAAPNPMKRMWEEPDEEQLTDSPVEMAAEPQPESLPVPGTEEQVVETAPEPQAEALPKAFDTNDEGYDSGVEEEGAHGKTGPLVDEHVVRGHDEL